jgi:DNA repair exonuclease SbcCD nuclease subunit
MISVAGCKVACLPWPRRASLLAWLGKPAGHEVVEAAGLEALRSILRGFAGAWRGFTGPKILLAHAMVRGSRQGPDQPIAPGCDFELGLEDLALAEATVNLLGHIHMPQEWVDGEGPFEPEMGDIDPVGSGWVPTIYAGSPRRTAYAAGELEPKGYVVLEFEDGRLVQWERVPTPATPMRLLEAEWNTALGAFGSEEAVARGNAGLLDPLPDLKGAEVRLRYEVDAVAREEAGRGAAVLRDRLLAAGAIEVKVEEVVRPLCRARAPEVAAAATLPLKLQAYWKVRGIELGAREPRVLARLQRLEEGVAS